jgi:class 3 adenylate cyclase
MPWHSSSDCRRNIESAWIFANSFSNHQEIIASERGAVVKTIGDAVTATFETPDRAIAAAIRMREAVSDIGAQRQYQSLRLHAQ